MANNTTRALPELYLSEGEFSSRISLAVHVVTLLIGSVANGLLLAVIATKTRRKTDQDILILNLCFSDWLIIIVKFSLKLDTNLRYIYWSNFMCKFVDLLPTVGHYAGIYTIVLMAVQRCRVLMNPFRAKMKLKVALSWCAIVWMTSFLAISPMVHLRESYKHKTCVSIPFTAEYQYYLYKCYTAVNYFFVFLFPLSVIAGSYICLGLYLSRHRVPRVAWVRGSFSQDAGRRKNLEIIRTLAVIVILFAVFMLPLFVVRVLYEFRSDSERVTEEFLNAIIYTRFLALSHSCVNPVIYGSLTRNFRRKYKTWILKYFRRKRKYPRARQWELGRWNQKRYVQSDAFSVTNGKYSQRPECLAAKSDQQVPGSQGTQAFHNNAFREV